ncbi:MAG: hypothetical protein JWN07_477 [Hyphomicrobiales bacterium]|nr:hypothetical protein [Hyphomicrobiales bacterium]
MDTDQSASPPMVVRTLLGAAGLAFSIKCLRTVLNRSVTPVRLVIHNDGSLGEEQKDQLRKDLSPSVTFVDTAEADDVVMPCLSHYPLLREFRAREVLAKKILDCSLLEESGRMRFCDSDIIFFRKYAGLFGATQGNECLFMQDIRSSYSFYWKLEARSLFPLPGRLNSGLIDFPTAALDLDLMEAALASGTLESVLWREQTLWAVLASRLKPLYPRGVIVPKRTAMPSDSLAWHLVTPLRPNWNVDDLIARVSAQAETVAHLELVRMQPVTYPRYMFLRTMSGLVRRGRLARMKMKSLRARPNS